MLKFLVLSPKGKLGMLLLESNPILQEDLREEIHRSFG